MVSNSYKKLKNVWWIDLEYLFLRENNRTFIGTNPPTVALKLRLKLLLTISYMLVKDYVSPLTVRTSVEVESAFCGASADVESPQGQTGEIEEQAINQEFSSDFDASGWE